MIARINPCRQYFKIVANCLAAAALLPPAAAEGVITSQQMSRVGGSIKEISAGADGSVFALSTTSTGSANGVSNYTVHKWNNSRSDWDSLTGASGYKIAVAADGSPWLVTAQGAIWRWNKTKASFEQVPGGGSNIDASADGSIYLNGGTPANGFFDNSMYKWNGSSWAPIAGASMQMAVEPLGTPWALASSGVAFRLFPDTRLGWGTVPGGLKMTYIAVGASGQVWASGSDDVGGGNHSTYQWDGQKWINTQAQTVRVAVEPDGRPWFVTAAGGVWRGQPQPVPMALFGKVTPPPPPPPAPTASADDDICWKVTNGRGVGKVPSYCPQGTVQDDTGLLCYPVCQSGYNGIGPVCWDFPKSYGRGAGKIKDGCGIGNEYDAGLCYPQCSANSSGVGPVCWGTCGGKYPVNCGAACAVSDLHCASAIVKMVSSVAESAVSIFGMVVSGGATAAGTAAFRAAAKSAASAGVKAATKAGLKAYLIQQAKDLARDLAEGEAEALATQAAENYLQTVAGGETGFDPASLDPTGIASVVQSFNKPMCEAQLISTVTPADPLTTINTTVFAVSNDGNLWANSGWVWIRVPGGANTSSVAVALDGTIWRLDTSGKASVWSGTGWTQFGPANTFKAITTAGGMKAWAVGADNAVYRFDGKQFMKMEGSLKVLVSGTSNNFRPLTPENIAIALDGTLYVSGRADSSIAGILKWDAVGERFSTIFYGQTESTSISSANRLYMLAITGVLATTSGGNIVQGIGNSPQGVQAVATGASGEIWFLNQNRQPSRVVKFTPGSGNLAPSIDTTVFDTQPFKQIAIR